MTTTEYTDLDRVRDCLKVGPWGTHTFNAAGWGDKEPRLMTVENKRPTHLACSLEWQYIDFERFHLLTARELRERSEAMATEVRNFLHITYHNWPQLRFSNIYGATFSWQVFADTTYDKETRKPRPQTTGTLHVYGGAGNLGTWPLTEDVAQRKEAFKDAVKRSEMVTMGKHPCHECGQEGATRKGLRYDLCDSDFVAYKVATQKSLGGYKCCDEAYAGHCVCVVQVACPVHGIRCHGSHD